MSHKNKLWNAVQQALLVSAAPAAAVALAGLALPAAAQNAGAPPTNGKKPETLQTIVVTGSHIRRVDIATDNPVVTVTAQQIHATGKLTLGAVVQDLPVITGGVENPQVDNGGGTGGTFVGLRGLGPSRTLILVDGQRVLNTDLNTIPVQAVERVEVLTSGASAIYGSDAIGGVINFILKSNYQGAQFTADYGISDHNDGERKGASFMFGQTSDKGSILAGVSYNKFDEITGADRSFSKQALSYGTTASGGFLIPPTVHPGGSPFAQRDFISGETATGAAIGCGPSGALSLNQSTFNAGTSPTTASDYHCFGPADRFNYSPFFLIETPQERTNGFIKGVFHLSPNVDFYATIYHNKTSSNATLAPAVFGTPTVAPGAFISANNFYNPFGVDFTAKNGNVYEVAVTPIGDRIDTYGSTTDQLITGFRGNVQLGPHNWQWNVGLDYGHFSRTEALAGLPDTSDLLPGLGPSFMNTSGVVQCGTPASPISLSTCTPWDPFNLNSASAKAALAASSTPALENSWSIERIYHVGANGTLFDLPAGGVELAVGGDYRKEYKNNSIGGLVLINPATLTCTLGSQCAGHTQGGFDVKEAYTELFIPILKDMPFAHGLNVTLADRYSDYSDFASTSNWKIGMEYRPIEDLLLRGTIAKVFRAPTVSDLFEPPTSSAPFISLDPCDGITAPNPACVNVPTNGTFHDKDDHNSLQLEGIDEGFIPAGVVPKPEIGKSFDFGVVYSPRQVPGLSASVDLWRIYLNDTITRIGAQTVLDQCFAGISEFCPLITRIAAGANQGQILHLVQPFGNLGRFDVKGIDIAANYRLPTFSFGQFTLGLHTTYTDQYKIQTAPGTPANEVFNGAGRMGWFGSGLESVCPFNGGPGGMCFLPRWRAQGTVDYAIGPISAQWRIRYIGDFELAGLPLGPQFSKFGSTTYNDVSLTYDIRPINTSVQVGVDNLMNRQPPLMYNLALNANSDPGDFDLIGRYYFANATVRF